MSAKKKRADSQKHWVKINFALEQEDGYPPVSSESVWASQASDGTLKIESIPFFTDEATFQDSVAVTDEEGELWFDELIEESDNSLIWIIFMESDGQEVINDLEAAGCDVERCNESQCAVNIPKNVRLKKIRKLLDQYAHNDELDYAEPILRQGQ
jgi:hypothetical protein